MYVSILLSSLLQTLIQWDTNITLAINGLHCGYLDNFMMMYSGKFIWIPLYVSLLVIMFRNFPRRAVIYCILVRRPAHYAVRSDGLCCAPTIV